MEEEKSQKNKTIKDLKSLLINKILELQVSSLDAKEQISTLVNFIQSLLEIDTIAVYANFANEEINLINSKTGAKQHNLLGHMLETISEQIEIKQTRYFNSLIPLTELNIKGLSDVDLNTYIYPILSPHAKELYGIVLITNPKLIRTPEEQKIFIFVLNYITKIIEEVDLASQVNAKGDRLKLLSSLSSSLRGLLKSEKAIEIVLKGIHSFLKLDDIYFARWIASKKTIEITQEIVSDKNKSLKGFIHKVSNKNPIIKLLYKNQYMTYKNKNIRRISKIFLQSKKPSIFCILPVLIRNELLGIVVCESTSLHSEVNTEDLRITQDICGQLAVILNQANLYEESLSTAQREFLLNSITTMIRDTLEVNGVLEKTAREIGQVFGVSACGAFIHKKEGTGFTDKSIWATKDEYEKKMSLFPIDPALWKENSSPFFPDPITQNISISNINSQNFSENETLINESGCKSYLACPLNKGNKTIGVLALAQFDSYRTWTNSEVQLLEAITDQVEMALLQAELHEHVQQTERQMNLLHQVSNAIRDTLNISTVMARTAQDLGEILGASRCFIRRLKSISPLQVLATEQEYLNKEQKINKAADLILDFEKTWLESLNNLPEVDRANSTLHIPDVPTIFKDSPDPLKTILEIIEIKSFLAVSLVAAGKVIGSLCIHQCNRNRIFTQNEIDFVKRVASEASIAVLNADLFTKVEYQAQRDSLTSLYNHAYFQTALHHEVERAKRTGSDLSVIMIDLDHLKSINDKFGHAAGDEAITLVGGKLQQCLRQMDIVARYGGDEFAVLLPETNLEEATGIAKRILEALNRTIHSQWGALSASIGVSGTPHEERNKEAIMKAADDVMYISKKEGRNRITISTILDTTGPVEQKPISRGK
ncbi:MAG: diguanylate cyclase [Candidatus Melainabacteria bacterium]|nr:diguanylate cyclase [Candidatus Melainabacteria bacterium]